MKYFWFLTFYIVILCSVTVLCGELLREAEFLVNQRIHPMTIMQGWRTAVQIARNALEKVSMSIISRTYWSFLHLIVFFIIIFWLTRLLDYYNCIDSYLCILICSIYVYVCIYRLQWITLLTLLPSRRTWWTSPEPPCLVSCSMWRRTTSPPWQWMLCCVWRAQATWTTSRYYTIAIAKLQSCYYTTIIAVLLLLVLLYCCCCISVD